jgi:DNA-binding XRE family transcriptional regulator
MNIQKQLTGERFKKLLSKKSITKYRLSKLTGISWQTLLYWERGIYKPSEKSAELAARVLGIIK